MKVTISDVAKLAGVSTATVSHTINNTRYVSSETKEKVYSAIAELGYTPDASARSFRTGKKKTVLLSTHIMQEVEAICDRVIIINQGKIVADRPIGEICTHADEGMVLRVEFSPGSDTHWLSKSELFTHTSQQAPNCWRLTSPQGKDPREALFFEAAVRRCPIIALHTEVYQLEDIFHRYTQNFPAKPGKD